MRRSFLVAATALVATALAYASPPTRHEVLSLPGISTDLPSRIVTGYINAGPREDLSAEESASYGDMYFHYWAAMSEGDASKDPVVIWYNGGPGASSLFGMLQEFGPLLLNSASFPSGSSNASVLPTPVRNLFAWTRAATVIAIDSPPPMGFSFCSVAGPSGAPTSCGPWTDTAVFAANHKAHVALFTEVFPEFVVQQNPVFFAGESYGGIYIPGFVEAWLDDPVTLAAVNLQGFMVGDGWTGCPAPPKGSGLPANYCIDLDNVGLFKYPNANYGPWYDVEFFHGHSQYSEDLYRRIRATCPEAQLRTPHLTKECAALVDEMAAEVGGWFAYDLYNSCAGAGNADVVPPTRFGASAALRHRRAVQQRVASINVNGGGGGAGGTAGAPCPGNAMAAYLASPEVQAALGIEPKSAFINLDNGHGFNYTSDRTQVTDIYAKAHAAGLRIMVYEGDSDACGLQTAPVQDVFVPYFRNISLAKTGPWRPWTTDGKLHMGGYVIEWEEGQVSFVSVRGAGHLVPFNRPRVSLALLRNFVAGNPLPKFVAKGEMEL